jgi:hypothetical protein
MATYATPAREDAPPRDDLITIEKSPRGVLRLSYSPLTSGFSVFLL